MRLECVEYLSWLAHRRVSGWAVGKGLSARVRECESESRKDGKVVHDNITQQPKDSVDIITYVLPYLTSILSFRLFLSSRDMSIWCYSTCHIRHPRSTKEPTSTIYQYPWHCTLLCPDQHRRSTNQGPPHFHIHARFSHFSFFDQSSSFLSCREWWSHF